MLSIYNLSFDCLLQPPKIHFHFSCPSPRLEIMEKYIKIQLKTKNKEQSTKKEKEGGRRENSICLPVNLNENFLRHRQSIIVTENQSIFPEREKSSFLSLRSQSSQSESSGSGFLFKSGFSSSQQHAPPLAPA